MKEEEGAKHLIHIFTEPTTVFIDGYEKDGERYFPATFKDKHDSFERARECAITAVDVVIGTGLTMNQTKDFDKTHQGLTQYWMKVRLILEGMQLSDI